jgi:hypothetical protein
MGNFWKAIIIFTIGYYLGANKAFGYSSNDLKNLSSHSHNGSYDSEEVSVSNPSLMHMHRKEFIAAGIAQGFAANGGMRTSTSEEFAKKVLEYTNALMLELDKKENR